MAVIPVGYRIDDSLSDDRAKNFERNGGLSAGCPCTHVAVDLVQHELHRLIYHFEQPSLIRLLGRDGLSFFRPMEIKAMDLCIVEKPVRILSEQKHGGVCGPAIPQQIEIFQNRFRGARPLEFQPTCGLGGFNKSLHLSIVDILERCPVTQAAIKRRGSDLPTVCQALDDTGVDLADQAVRI